MGKMNNSLTLDGSSDRIYYNLREKEEKRSRERRRHLIYLISAYLHDRGYTKTSDMLSSEAQLSEGVQVCDNIDLDMILMEYEGYYYTRFGRYPTLCKNEITKCPAKKQYIQDSKGTNKNDLEKGKSAQQTTDSVSKNDVNLAMTVTPLFCPESGNQLSIKEAPKRQICSNISDIIEILYPSDSEFRKIAEAISKEIVLTNLNVHWDDVIGLDECKAAVREAAVYPIKYPIFFRGKFSPWKGILLYGPPGTGKTMLAKAVATECNCTFFNITVSSLVSKWRGDSEKYIRVLFDLAYCQSPTIIFIDEIDWISTTMNDDVLSEPARRFRAELLARLDGLTSDENSNVLLLATTNVPWAIDAALLRRLEKRIQVQLPDRTTRLDMLRYYVSAELKRSKNIDDIVTATEGYSGADIKLLCKQAWILQIYPTWKLIGSKDVSILDVNYEITDIDHLIAALDNIKPTTKHLPKYDCWNENLVGRTKKQVRNETVECIEEQDETSYTTQVQNERNCIAQVQNATTRIMSNNSKYYKH